MESCVSLILQKHIQKRLGEKQYKFDPFQSVGKINLSGTKYHVLYVAHMSMHTFSGLFPVNRVTTVLVCAGVRRYLTPEVFRTKTGRGLGKTDSWPPDTRQGFYPSHFV